MIEFLVAVAWPTGWALLLGFAVILLVTGFILFVVFTRLGAFWLQASMSGADISMKSLIVMTLLRIEPRLIVTAKIMASQAGLSPKGHEAMTTDQLQSHHLAGGDVMRVVKAQIAAHRAGIDLNFDRATAIDLAGRDVLLAVQTSVSPRVIQCPQSDTNSIQTLSAVARNGVELRVRARVTVRTNLDQLVGGATEETIIARVGQGIISSIGAAESHMDVLAMPSKISDSTMARGLDANTAFSIVSIDINEIDVGENIGARLQSDQANADIRIARAFAEGRRAEALALKQQMIAKVAEERAAYILAEAEVPAALAFAFRASPLQMPTIENDYDSQPIQLKLLSSDSSQ